MSKPGLLIGETTRADDAKQALRATLARDLANYLAAGGAVAHVATGATGGGLGANFKPDGREYRQASFEAVRERKGTP